MENENGEYLPQWRPEHPHLLFELPPETRGEIISDFERELAKGRSPDAAAESVRQSIDLLNNWPSLPAGDLEAAAAGRDTALSMLLGDEGLKPLREISRFTGMGAEAVIQQALIEHLRVLSPGHPLVREWFFDAWGEVPCSPEPVS